MKVTSFAELSKLEVGSRIQVERAGTHYKARYAGCAAFVFGLTKQEAEKRLRDSEKWTRDSHQYVFVSEHHKLSKRVRRGSNNNE